eukprot:m.112656 g.112656  ORF g.112656 m.112656 type:complete len:439 (-) comp13484_c0_seq1:543-1859(-)
MKLSRLQKGVHVVPFSAALMLGFIATLVYGESGSCVVANTEDVNTLLGTAADACTTVRLDTGLLIDTDLAGAMVASLLDDTEQVQELQLNGLQTSNEEGTTMLFQAMARLTQLSKLSVWKPVLPTDATPTFATMLAETIASLLSSKSATLVSQEQPVGVGMARNSAEGVPDVSADTGERTDSATEASSAMLSSSTQSRQIQHHRDEAGASKYSAARQENPQEHDQHQQDQSEVSTLTSLYVSDIHFPVAAVQAIALSLQASSLESLTIRDVDVEDETMALLLSNLPSSLVELEISCMADGDFKMTFGAKALASLVNLQRLEQLNKIVLSGLHIASSDMGAITNALAPLLSVKVISLHNNQIGTEAVPAIKRLLQSRRLNVSNAPHAASLKPLLIFTRNFLTLDDQNSLDAYAAEQSTASETPGFVIRADFSRQKRFRA